MDEDEPLDEPEEEEDAPPEPEIEEGVQVLNGAPQNQPVIEVNF